MSCWYNRSKVSRELILLRTDWTPQLRYCTQRNERLESHREQDACLLPFPITLFYTGYLSSVGSAVSKSCLRSASRRHASLLAFARRFTPSNAATRQPGLRPVNNCSSYLSRSACSLFGRMLCESSTFSISHFAPLVTNRVSLFPGNLLG